MEMMPIVDGLEEEFAGHLPVIRLNALEDENAALQAEFNLFGHPAFAVLDSSSRITGTFFGPQPAETLREAMTAVLEN